MNDILSVTEGIQNTKNQLDLLPVLFNFILCVGMSFIIREFYIRRSFSLTGKFHIASVIPILSSVVFLVIIIVKSSLALSLGLVGALSIVRFRTPIKEPEELVYLFLAISTGLGYAAGHTLVTTLIVLMIITIIYLWLSNRKGSAHLEYNMVLSWSQDSLSLTSLVETISSYTDTVKLVRFDVGNNNNTAVLLLSPAEKMDLTPLTEKIREHDPNITISFYEAKTNW
jgi:hypothetical protein